MKVSELKNIIDELVDKGFGDHNAVFSLWTNSGRKDYFMHYPCGGQIIANKYAVYVGIADDCRAHSSDEMNMVSVGLLFKPTKSKPVENVYIQLIGSAWILRKEMINEKGESEAGDDIDCDPIISGESLVKYCNEKKYHVVDRGSLIKKLRDQLKY